MRLGLLGTEQFWLFYLKILLIFQVVSTDDGQNLPSFLVDPQQFKARLGQDLRLPCPTSGTGGAVITWSWNGRLISAGDMKIYSDQRLEVGEGGRELLVRGIMKEDRGDWTCTLEMKQQPVSLTHRLEVMVAPQVVLLGSQDQVEVEEGTTAKFDCSATGFPPPSVHWSLESDPRRILSSSSSLTLSDMRPEQAGGYLCVAENSQGTSNKLLKINVLYKPRTKLTRKTTSRDSYSSSTLLSCLVESNPKATVKVYKESQLVSSALIKSSVGQSLDTYSLSLTTLSESDYGNYSCVARNLLGTSSDWLMVTGSPDQPLITGERQGLLSTSYKLVWTVWSPPGANILNQSILYRRIIKGVKTSRPDTDTSSWYNLALISDTATFTNSYSMVLTQLETDSQYEVRLRAMNKHGWSSLSEPFIFNTASEESENELLSSSLLSSSSQRMFSFSLTIPSLLYLLC